MPKNRCSKAKLARLSRLRSAPNTDISTGGGQTAVARRKEQLLTALGIIVRYPAGTPTVPRDVEDAERRVFDLVGVLALSASQTGGFDPVAIYVFGHLVECGFVERLLYIRLIPRDQLKAEGVLCHHSDISLPLLEALRRLAVGAKVVSPRSARSSRSTPCASPACSSST